MVRAKASDSAGFLDQAACVRVPTHARQMEMFDTAALAQRFLDLQPVSLVYTKRPIRSCQ
jgi:hypothetical protein